MRRKVLLQGLALLVCLFMLPASSVLAQMDYCEGNFDFDPDQDGSDAAKFKVDFGRSQFNNPCRTFFDPCFGDFDDDNDNDGTDAALFKTDFGRSSFNNPCPLCDMPAPEIPVSMIQGSLKAEFFHTNQSVSYRTFIDSKVDLQYVAEPPTCQDPDRTFLIFYPSVDFGVVAWEVDGGVPQEAGPIAIAVAAPVSDEELNAYIDGGKSEIAPGLAIPIILQSGDPNGNERYWENEKEVVVRIFIRGCSDGKLRTHGDLTFPPGALTFRTWTDEAGDPHTEINGDQGILTPDSETWSLMLADCTSTDVLPQEIFTGSSNSFTLDNTNLPPDPETLSGQFELIVKQFRSLLYNETLLKEEVEALLAPLNLVSLYSLQKDGLQESMNQLYNFLSEVGYLVQQQRLDSKQALYLLDRADIIENQIDLIHNPTIPGVNLDTDCPNPPDSCPDEPCTYTTYYVVHGSTVPNPDGSVENPFPTIVDALDYAALENKCGVNLEVGEGHYVSDLTITRHTTIRRAGAVTYRIKGSVINNGPHYVSIENGSIEPPSGSGIISDHPCARTWLNNVEIWFPTGYGIYQRGGLVYADGLVVAGTHSLPNELETGIGIFMSCGARGNLVDTIINASDSCGLLIDGRGTELGASFLQITDTRVHPDLRISHSCSPIQQAALGAVSVRDQASLLVNGYDIRDNTFLGIKVYSNGSAQLNGSVTIELGEIMLCLANRQTGEGYFSDMICTGQYEIEENGSIVMKDCKEKERCACEVPSGEPPYCYGRNGESCDQTHGGACEFSCCTIAGASEVPYTWERSRTYHNCSIWNISPFIREDLSCYPTSAVLAQSGGRVRMTNFLLGGSSVERLNPTIGFNVHGGSVALDGGTIGAGTCEFSSCCGPPYLTYQNFFEKIDVENMEVFTTSFCCQRDAPEGACDLPVEESLPE